jgi:hypothetical protein
MSGNINDTNIEVIKSQVQSLIKDIDNLSPSESAIEYEHNFKKKYKHLASTSNTLFMYIIKNYDSNTFNKQFFDQTLNLMLSKISNIQNKTSTQHDASSYIGTHLAKKYIPHL